MARYSDEQRNKVKALWDARQAAWAAIDAYEEENAQRLEAIEAKYAPFRAALFERHAKERDELYTRQDKEADALEAEERKGLGTVDLHAAVDAAEEALRADASVGLLLEEEDEVVVCAKSGKPILDEEDTVEDEDGKLCIAAEMGVPETAEA